MTCVRVNGNIEVSPDSTVHAAAPQMEMSGWNFPTYRASVNTGRNNERLVGLGAAGGFAADLEARCLNGNFLPSCQWKCKKGTLKPREIATESWRVEAPIKLHQLRRHPRGGLRTTV